MAHQILIQAATHVQHGLDLLKTLAQEPEAADAHLAAASSHVIAAVIAQLVAVDTSRNAERSTLTLPAGSTLRFLLEEESEPGNPQLPVVVTAGRATIDIAIINAAGQQQASAWLTHYAGGLELNAAGQEAIARSDTSVSTTIITRAELEQLDVLVSPIVDQDDDQDQSEPSMIELLDCLRSFTTLLRLDHSVHASIERAATPLHQDCSICRWFEEAGLVYNQDHQLILPDERLNWLSPRYWCQLRLGQLVDLVATNHIEELTSNHFGDGTGVGDTRCSYCRAIAWAVCCLAPTSDQSDHGANSALPEAVVQLRVRPVPDEHDSMSMSLLDIFVQTYTVSLSDGTTVLCIWNPETAVGNIVVQSQP